MPIELINATARRCVLCTIAVHCAHAYHKIDTLTTAVSKRMLLQESDWCRLRDALLRSPSRFGSFLSI